MIPQLVLNRCIFIFSLQARFMTNTTITECFYLLSPKQRLVLGVVFSVSCFGIALENKKWPAIFLLWLLISLLLVAGYHLLVQWGFVVDRCTTPQNVQTLNDLRSLLHATAPCTVSWSLMGLPAAIYNVAFALLGIFALKTAYGSTDERAKL